MLNRALQVKMVRNEKNETPDPDQIDLFHRKAAIIGLYLRSTVVTVGKVALVYIAADTVRQVMVANANK